MIPSHDFSKPKPPAPATAPPPAPPRSRPSNLVLAVAAIAVMAVLVGVVAVLRGGEDDTPELLDSRFCQASVRLGDALGGIGIPVAGPVPGAVTPEALRGALDSVGEGALGELEETAPSKVRGDVKRVLGDLRDAASGDMAGGRSPAFTKARADIVAIQQPPYGCPVQGDSSGDG